MILFPRFSGFVTAPPKPHRLLIIFKNASLVAADALYGCYDLAVPLGAGLELQLPLLVALDGPLAVLVGAVRADDAHCVQ